MGFFENNLAGLGRWLDDRVASMRSGASADGLSRAKESVSRSVAKVQETAGEQVREGLTRVQQVDRDDKRVQRVMMVALLVVGITLGVVAGARFLGGQGTGGLTSEDLATVRALRQSQTAGQQFQTVAPPPAPPPAARDARPVRTPRPAPAQPSEPQIEPVPEDG